MARANILVVEDESIVAMDIQERLRGLGYAVSAVASSGEEAIQKAAETHPDLVLMDIMLKGDMDGVEAAEQIRARFDIPVIYLTAYADENTLQRAMITEPFGYIIKPFEERELHTTIEMALYKHKMERKLRESEQWFATTLRSIGDAVIATDIKGSVTFMNSVAEALTGWKREDALGRDLKEVFHIVNEETQSLTESPVTKALREEVGVGLANHSILIAKDGREIPIDDSAAPIRDDKGNVTGVVLVFRDITERKRMEEALRESERRFKDISFSMADWIWEVDKNGKYTFASGKAKQVLGYAPKEIIGKTPFELMPEDEAKKVGRIFKKISLEKKPIVDLENWNLTKQGEKICLLTNGLPILDEKSNLLGYRGVDTDITDRKRAEEEKAKLENQLRQAQKMEAVGTLAGGIAHDFNNLLGGILGYSSLLLSKLAPDDPHRKYVELIERASNRAAELTNRLLGFARQGKYEDKPVDINYLIGGVVELISASVDKRIEIKAELCEDNPLTKGDQNQLEQVLMNLCVNARDAMPNGGQLSINSRQVHLDEGFASKHLGATPGDYLCITVSDTGMGMDKRTKTKIFDPFFTTKEQGRGTGLGLAMVYGIVKNHNGYLSVYSEAGKGTTFEIYLPLAQDSLIRPERKEEKVSLGSESILVVDDEEILRHLMKDILGDLGYGVVLASDGQEAVDVYREHKEGIDLVIVDMMMPKMGGKETFQELKRINPEVKALLASGYSKNAAAQGILNLGVRDFLHKPFSMEEISRKVREVLDAR